MAAKKKTGMAAQVAYRMSNLPYGGMGMSGAAPIHFGSTGIGGAAAAPKAPAARPAPVAPVAPVAPPAAAASAAAAPPADPTAQYKDSGYYAAIGQNIAKRASGLAGLQEGDSRLRADTATSLERLARNYAGQRQNLTEGANKSGLFYSGILGKRLGDAETANADQQGDINKAMTRGLFDNESARTDLIKQYGNPADANDYGLAGADALVAGGQRYAASHPVPATVMGRPGENGLPQGFNTGGWQGLAPGYTIEWDTATGKAKRIVKQ